MIPLWDDAPSLTKPFFTWVLIVVNVGIFLYQFSLGFVTSGAQEAFIASYAVVPSRVAGAITGSEPLAAGLIPVFTSMFLHGGWMHLIGNMWFLRIFGDNVEDELGHFSFLLFFVGCGVIAAVAQLLADPGSGVPIVGASGAIAGVMGAYLIRFPRARVTVLLPLVIIWTKIRLPAFLMLTYWLVIQVLSGTDGAAAGGVAWWAHIGGFVAGAGLILTRPRRRQWHRTWRAG
ncbi:MAG: rhomboid family intramembrane serine protease [Bryobacterales bacterium]|nr:rhomboid family intramembrane serine protease [Bryobacterales bacterium]